MIAELNAKLTAAEVHSERIAAELSDMDERYQRTISSMKELEEALNKSRVCISSLLFGVRF